jgi:uncharacterized protein (TIGR03086 family)
VGKAVFGCDALFMEPDADADAQLLDDLDRASAAFAQLVDGVSPDQLTASTPCPGVDVRMLVKHLMEGSRYFAALLTRSQPADTVEPAAESLPVAFRAAAAQMLAAFFLPGIFNEIFDSPVGQASGAELARVRLIELVAHGWDLTRATSQSIEVFPADLCDRALVAARQLVTERGRGRFGEQQPVPGDASSVDQLAAYLGRSP